MQLTRGIKLHLETQIIVETIMNRFATLIIAATTLANAGYTNVWDLAGGMLAWEAAGFKLLLSQ